MISGRNNKKVSLSNEKTRRRFWLVNAFISLFSRLTRFKRKPNIWVFGCWEGRRYDDNSKYLFEYILKNEPSITPFWITRSKEVQQKVSASGKPILLSEDKEAKRIMKKAGVAFYTNGLDDFSNYCYVKGALIIDLNHAPIGVKEVSYYNYKSCFFLKRWLKQLKRFLFDWFYFDYAIVTSDKCESFWKRAFSLDNSKKLLRVKGLPRYDTLLLNKQEKKENDIKTILYLPTYRRYDNSVVNNVFASISDDEEFKSVLKEKRAKIIIKPHFEDFFVHEDKNKSTCVELMPPNSILSTQELLSISDCLITDYSSCCVDFSILSRPIVFYTPDFDKYSADNGISEEFKDFFSVIETQYDVESLKKRLVKIIEDNFSNNNESLTLDRMFNGSSKQNNHHPFCQEVTNLIKSKVKNI